ncbi:phenylalanine ammonia-lyase, partial [bacterium]|nr:phenylalanine ammonia-lyase [bacterium]
DNAWGILAIEAIAAAQALDLRAPHSPGAGAAAGLLAVRAVVDRLREDRPLHDDHNAMKDALASGAFLEAVEGEIGPLA